MAAKLLSFSILSPVTAIDIFLTAWLAKAVKMSHNW